MSLLFYEPFDGYELNTAAFTTKYQLEGTTGTNVLNRSNGGITGRPSGSVFWTRFLDSDTVWLTFPNNSRETITYLAYCPIPSGFGDHALRFRNGPASELFSLTITPATITITNNTTTVFTSTNSIAFSQWNFLEIRSVISTGSLSGSVQIRNNGQLLFSASNLNLNSSNIPPFYGTLGIDTNAATAHIDDILILSVDGTTFNGPIGSGNFFMTSFVPSASGFYADMTSSGASTDANAINERPANNDASYLIATASGPFPLRETFTLRPVNTGSVGITIPSNAVIEGVLKDSVVRSSLVSVAGFKHLIRTNGQDYTGSTPISASTTYTDFTDSWQLNPNTGNKFTSAEISTLQVGFIRES